MDQKPPLTYIINDFHTIVIKAKKTYFSKGTTTNGTSTNGTAPDRPATPDSTTASEGEEEEEEPALLNSPPFTYSVYFPLGGKNKHSVTKREFLNLACADLQENKVVVTQIHREPRGSDATGATMYVLMDREGAAEARRLVHSSIQLEVDSFVGESQVIRSPDDMAAEAQLRADMEAAAANGSNGHESSAN